MFNRHSIFALLAIGLLLAYTPAIRAQRNNPFSSNPQPRGTPADVKPVDRQQISPVTNSKVENRSAAGTVRTATDPTETYKVGAGDVLYVVLANAPNSSGYYSVRSDGSIDFPLAGQNVNVDGMTVGEIEEFLSTRVTIYRDARLTITVREFHSHRINVSGMVERNGERFLQREAMPLFTIIADVGVDNAARKATIKHSSGRSETYDLSDARAGDALVSTCDVIEFTGER
jgi:protein involved in polysaccharide export with SLBB domain